VHCNWHRCDHDRKPGVRIPGCFNVFSKCLWLDQWHGISRENIAEPELSPHFFHSGNHLLLWNGGILRNYVPLQPPCYGGGHLISASHILRLVQNKKINENRGSVGWSELSALEGIVEIYGKDREKQEELELGLESLANKYGLNKIEDIIARMSQSKKG